ncbi:MAG TPA: hypothetical protein PK076_01545 [Saprospiraceae bacterium]|nr:hypothetical protein [Saprospiraceae bacterium]HQW54775.1 hypothetical protein [Saprospiraceae bacterium]
MKIVKWGLIGGVILSLTGYLGIYVMIHLSPNMFDDYYNPIFKSSPDRNFLFYTHGFILALVLSWLWEKTKSLYHGTMLLRAGEFTMMYVITAFIPIFWLTLSAMDLTFSMIFTWLIYGAVQTLIAGLIYSKFNP